MLGLLLPIVLTSVIGALWVGSTAGLQRMRVQWWPLAVGSIAIQLVLYNPPVDQQPWAMTFGPWIWVASLVAVRRSANRFDPAHEDRAQKEEHDRARKDNPVPTISMRAVEVID